MLAFGAPGSAATADACVLRAPYPHPHLIPLGSFHLQASKEPAREERIHWAFRRVAYEKVLLQLKKTSSVVSAKASASAPFFRLRPLHRAAEALRLCNMEEPRLPLPHCSTGPRSPPAVMKRRSLGCTTGSTIRGQYIEPFLPF